VSLRGQYAVVIGGSRGLGEAIVKRLAEAGASVVFTGRRLETLQPIAETVTAAGGTAVPVASDVSKVEESQRVIDLAVDRFGRVDILVNNAAVFEARVALETTEENAVSKDQLLTLEEVSARTGLATQTLYQMRARGEGPASFRLGNRVRVRESALEAWLAEMEAAEADRLARIAP
jgi:excisionase family DNA binding protein